MKEIIWATECAKSRRPQYRTAAITVACSLNSKNRTLRIGLSPDVYTKAGITPDDTLDVGLDSSGFRVAIRTCEAGPCHLNGKSLSGHRLVSLNVRPEWHIKPELAIPNDVCSLEIVKHGYIQARLPQSWVGAFV